MPYLVSRKELQPRDSAILDNGHTNSEFFDLVFGEAREHLTLIAGVLADADVTVSWQECQGGWKLDRPAQLSTGLVWPVEQTRRVREVLEDQLQSGRLRGLAGLVVFADERARSGLEPPPEPREVRSELLVLQPDLRPLDDRLIRDAVAKVCERRTGAQVGNWQRDIRVEAVAIGGSVLRRVGLPRRPEWDRLDTRQLDAEIKVWAKAVEAELGLPTSSVDYLHHALFSPGSVSFQPGSITFQPGSITFQPGSVSFQPGSVSFQPTTRGGLRVAIPEPQLTYLPASVRPRPADPPAELLEQLRRERWRRANRGMTSLPRVRIAILDTGIDAECESRHPLLAGRTAPRHEEGTADIEEKPLGEASPYYGHGTFVAGIVAHRAPFALINHESVRNRSGLTDAYEIAADLNDVWDADVICLSFGVAARRRADVEVLARGVDFLHQQGKVLVAAAGNSSELAGEDGDYDPDLQFFPAAFDGVIGVGAVDSQGDPAPFSPVKPWVTVWSYGVDVKSAFPYGPIRWEPGGIVLSFDGWARLSGTSMAAPRVAAAIADAASRTGASPRQIADDLIADALRIPDPLNRPLVV